MKARSSIRLFCRQQTAIVYPGSAGFTGIRFCVAKSFPCSFRRLWVDESWKALSRGSDRSHFRERPLGRHKLIVTGLVNLNQLVAVQVVALLDERIIRLNGLHAGFLPSGSDKSIRLGQYRTNELVRRRMNFSSDAMADFEGLLEVNRKICKQQMAEKASPTLPTNCAVLP